MLGGRPNAASLLLLLLLVAAAAASMTPRNASPFHGVRADSQLMPQEPLTRFAFGSCSKPDLPQPLWPHVVARRTQVFAWLGDIIYADLQTGILPHQRVAQPIELGIAKYDAQKRRKGYRELAASGAIIVGVYDDHDYGINNGDRTFPDKAASKEALMNFLDEPQDSVRRQREGAYASYTFGPPGKRVMLLLLDGRYFLPECTSADSDMLGEQQWAWLEQQLRASDAQVHLIGSGVQVVSDDKDTFIPAESWGRHYSSRQRLLRLIAELELSGVVFLSGDIHMAEISALKCSPVSYTLFDVTSSGMTHSWAGQLPWSSLLIPLGHFIVPSRFRVDEPYSGLNVGAIEFDWDKSLITVEIVDEHGNAVIHREIELQNLQPMSQPHRECSEEDIRVSLMEPHQRDFHWTWKIRFIVVISLLFGCPIFIVMLVVKSARQIVRRLLALGKAKQA